ncbi:MAG: hypothetical protein C4542_09390 [Dehalococcoidia bacterium]|nr:MAG: hypothetical protein C4542_09390 [Dehalococcoidia bacterium]
MAETWQNSYGELQKFIVTHPTIEIDMSSVVITGDIRPEFYKLFDTVRASFIKERFAAELEKAYAMSAAYGATSKAVKEEMRLEGIEINANLNWFLLDPINGLMRVLFDPLFDLLKGKTDLAGFTGVADTAVADSFEALFREGYERWGELALLQLLAPDKLWLGKAHDYYTDPSMEGDIAEGNRDESVPDLVESRKLVFDNLVRASFVVPGALVHSVRLDYYVSLRPNWYLPRWKARTLSERLEWIELKTLYKDFGADNLWPDMLIHVAGERPEELKLVADYYHLARPEIIIEFMEEDGWWDAKGVADIMRHNTALNPRLGSYVISRVEVPPEAFKPPEAAPGPVSAISAPDVAATSETPVTTTDANPLPMSLPMSLAELPANVHVLSVGYDMSKLEPVVEALAKATAMIKEARAKELQAEQNPGG